MPLDLFNLNCIRLQQETTKKLPKKEKDGDSTKVKKMRKTTSNRREDIFYCSSTLRTPHHTTLLDTVLSCTLRTAPSCTVPSYTILSFYVLCGAIPKFPSSRVPELLNESSSSWHPVAGSWDLASGSRKLVMLKAVHEAQGSSFTPVLVQYSKAQHRWTVRKECRIQKHTPSYLTIGKHLHFHID